MNAEKYTQKALEAVKTAQNMAQENGNQYVTTEHLLYALLDQDGGLIGSLFGKMGVDCDGLLSELDTLIRNLPRISGGSGEVYASPEVGKILNLAEKTAEKLHDEYLSVEHLMLAIFSEEREHPPLSHPHTVWGNHNLVICTPAVFSINFLVPTVSNATSSSASPPIGVTEMTSPSPNVLWWIWSPEES